MATSYSEEEKLESLKALSSFLAFRLYLMHFIMIADTSDWGQGVTLASSLQTS